ncbi:MAG: SDR family oxidoreductase [Chloroflexota bacterium]|nr:MAG: SDR family oxidoreductase [Chloroflexota bacterium]
MSGALKDRVAIITGASRGMGKTFALKFAEEGAKLLLTTTNLKRAGGTVDEVKAKGGDVAIVEADISHEDAGEKIAESVMKQYGRVDILVNNAAIWYGVSAQPWNSWSVKEWDQMFVVNVRGTWVVCKAIAPLMIKQKKGKIINIASNVARVPAAQLFLPYSCTKGAVYILTHALARALGPSGINVNAVAPGYVSTEASLAQPDSDKIFEIATGEASIHERLQPTDPAGAVLFLASAASDMISGQIIYVDGGTVMI